MKTQIDIKSALFGLGVGVLVTFVIGAASPPGPAIGRYQIAGTAGHGLVLDTATGEVWSGFFPSDRGATGPGFMEPKNGEKR
jgi:hypothetical protein